MNAREVQRSSKGPRPLVYELGWFLSNAALMSHQQIIVQDVLEDVPVSRLRSDAPTVSPSIAVSSLVHAGVMDTGERVFPVIKGDRLTGLVCLEDIRKLSRDTWDTTKVNEIMTRVDHLTVVNPLEMEVSQNGCTKKNSQVSVLYFRINLKRALARI